MLAIIITFEHLPKTGVNFRKVGFHHSKNVMSFRQKLFYGICLKPVTFYRKCQYFKANASNDLPQTSVNFRTVAFSPF